MESKKDISVVNIVVTASLGQPIPLEKMVAALANVEYNPETFPGLIKKIKSPTTSILVFRSGRIVCTGAKTREKVRESINVLLKDLEKINIKIKIEPEIRVTNVVAAGSINRDLNLNKLAMSLRNTEYEPEQFPGLVYKIFHSETLKPTFLLFSNGKIVCAGLKDEKDKDKAVDLLLENLDKVM